MYKSCSCPYGCCSCGPSRDEDLAVIYDPNKNEIYLFDVTGTSFKIEKHCEQVEDIYICMLVDKEQV